MTHKELKAKSLEIMRNSGGNVFLGTLVIPLVLFLSLSDGSTLGYVISFVAISLIPTVTLLGIKLVKEGRMKITPKDNLFGAKGAFSDFIDIIILNLLIGVFIMLWTLLFIIPGLIKTYSYSQAINIYFEHKTKGERISYLDAITFSRYEMNGLKMDLFLLHLSFIGYAIPLTAFAVMGSITIINGNLFVGAILYLVFLLGYWLYMVYVSLTVGAWWVDNKPETVYSEHENKVK